MSTRRLWLSVRARWSVLALALLAQFYVFVHRAWTVHVVCPLDGELAHPELAVEVSELCGDDPVLVSFAATEEHAEHCELALATPPARALSLTSWPGHPLEAVLANAGRFAPLCMSDGRLYLLAPKQSPPVHAG